VGEHGVSLGRFFDLPVQLWAFLRQQVLYRALSKGLDDPRVLVLPQDGEDDVEALQRVTSASVLEFEDRPVVDLTFERCGKLLITNPRINQQIVCRPVATHRLTCGFVGCLNTFHESNVTMVSTTTSAGKTKTKSARILHSPVHVLSTQIS